VDKLTAASSSSLYYREEGSGLPVVLLHGFAEDGAIWDNQVSYLSAYCRVIVPDLPGSGRSPSLGQSPALTSPEGVGPAYKEGLAGSIEELAGSIATLLDQLAIQQCILIGHSMGGYIALAFAEKYPERLNALGLFHSTAYADNEEKKTGRRKSIEFIRNNGSAAFIRQSIPNLFSGYAREYHPDLIDSIISRYSGFSPDSLIAYYEAMIARPDRTAILRQFAGPVLFIIGQADGVIPMEQVLQQCHLPAVSHIHIIENAGHMGMLEVPDRSNTILHSFINFVLYS
jgi:pimeloyl-ACP methyl ester carboxylesterase